MTREEVIAGLKQAARQSDNAATASDAATAIFKPKFEAAFYASPRDTETINDLYCYAIRWPEDAARFRREAEIFRSAVALLEQCDKIRKIAHD